MKAILNGPRLSAASTAFVAALAGLALASSLEAQAPIPAPRQSQPIALRGATIHTVTNGVIENGTIVFDNGLITAVGADVAVPTNAQVVDVTGKHIYPGLVDAYSSVGITEIGAVDVTSDVTELGDFNPNARPDVAFNPESRHIGTSRTNGVLVTLTTPEGGLIPGLSSAMNLDGWTWEQMTLESAAALNVNWPDAGGGSGDDFDDDGDEEEPDYEEEIRRIREYFAQARAYRDVKAAGGTVPSDSRFDAMIPALDGDIPVVVSADDVRQILDAVRWAEEEGLRIVIRGGGDAIHVADRLAERQIPVILTTTMDAPARDWEPYDHTYARAAQLHAKGVKIAISGGSGAAYTNRLPYEAGVAVAFGLPEEEAIKAVTLNPAEFMGIADRVGSLEAGKQATLLITTGSPLDYLANIEQAYIEGREIDMRDIHRFFFEKYMEKLRQMRRVVSQ
jgi:imidazolonepropionase-like amidohydrolase